MKKINRIFSIIFVTIFAITIFCGTAFAKVNNNIKISNINVTDVNASGYTITCDISSDKGIAYVLFPTWTEANGQDDLLWNLGTVSGNKATFRVNTANHNNEVGNYITHIYVHDLEDNISNPVAAVTNIAAAKTSLSIAKENTSESSYTLTVEASKDIKTIGMATWTEANGQDDLTWQFKDISNGLETVTIAKGDHGNIGGVYINHIYGYDSSGNILTLIGYNITLPEASNSYIKITDVRTGDGFYDIDFEHSADVVTIYYATWTEANGQDDLLWLYCSAYDISTRILSSDHNNEVGTYFTHLYAVTSDGRTLPVVGETIEMTSSSPFISITSEFDDTAYSIHVDGRNNVARLGIATWTEANGQDDLKWQFINSNSGDFYINRSEHNYEDYVYINHIYAYDANGNILGLEGYNINIQVDPITYSYYDILNYSYDLYFFTRNDVYYVKAATWTEKNGQDDLVWSDTYYNSYTGYWSLVVNTVYQHNNEDGVYINHLYAYDINNNFIGILGVNVDLGQKLPSVYGYVYNRTTDGFNIEYSLLASQGIKKVLIATWTEKNGQDDIIWKQLNFNGNLQDDIIYQVYLSEHNNESGIYHTHIYLYDNNDNYALYGIDYNVPTILN